MLVSQTKLGNREVMPSSYEYLISVLCTLCTLYTAKTYLRTFKTSMIEFFAKTVKLFLLKNYQEYLTAQKKAFH